MEFLGVGPLEVLLILIVALLVVKPEDWGRTARILARWIKSITSSDVWRAINEGWRAASDFSVELQREVRLEEALKEVDQITRRRYWTEAGLSGAADASNPPGVGEPDPNVIRPPRSAPYAHAQPVQPAKVSAPAKKSPVKKSKPSAPAKPRRKKSNA